MYKTREYTSFDKELPVRTAGGFCMMYLGKIPSSVRGSDNISNHLIEKRKLLNDSIERDLGL
jgi:hypothetical protein